MLLIILCAMCSIITLAFRDWEGGGGGEGRLIIRFSQRESLFDTNQST